MNKTKIEKILLLTAALLFFIATIRAHDSRYAVFGFLCILLLSRKGKEE